MAGRFILDGEMRPVEITVEKNALFMMPFLTSVASQIELFENAGDSFFAVVPEYGKVTFVGRVQKRSDHGKSVVFEFIVDGIYREAEDG
jgi:hypothetical protein